MRFLPFRQGRFYAQNRYQWFKTVKETTHYLNTVLKKDETFLALPYDTLYYFLTGRTSPTRLLLFFEYNNIVEEQEREVIAALQNKNVNYILISNRSAAKERGMGTFGKTHCQMLAQYIKDNYETVAVFGEWSQEPTYMDNHGTKILRKKSLKGK